MGTSIATIAAPDIYEAKASSCGGFAVNVVLSRGVVQWISVESIKRALPGIEQYPQWQRFSASCRLIKLKMGNAPTFEAYCIAKRDFFDAALTHKDSDAFRTAVSEICEQYDNGGASLPVRFPNDPLVQLATVAQQLAIGQAEHRERIENLEYVQGRQSTAIDEARNLAEISLAVQLGRDGRLKGIPELGRRGWIFKPNQYGVIGSELAKIAAKIGDPDYNKDGVKMLWNGDYVNMHLPKVFDIWERECGHKYPRRRGKTTTGGT